MPKTVAPVIAAGSLGTTPQPHLNEPSGLVLRPWVAEDSPQLMDAFQDPAIQFWHTRTISSTEEATTLIEDYADGWRAESRANWAILSSAGELLGRISLNPMNLQDGEAEIGYWVRSAARGRGVAVNAVNALTSWAYRVGFHRVIIHHSTANPASCSVARRAGFDLEGTRKSALMHPDGWHDMHLHARINGQ
jgi:[ribosomal protein S5]-alanine N-acetyltransferase